MELERKKGQCILGGSLSFVALKQQQNIKFFDFCKKKVQKTESEEDEIFL